MSRFVALTVVLCASALSAGCTNGAAAVPHPSPSAGAQQVAVAFLNAAGAGDDATVCAVTSGGCPDGGGVAVPEPEGGVVINVSVAETDDTVTVVAEIDAPSGIPVWSVTLAACAGGAPPWCVTGAEPVLAGRPAPPAV